MSIHSCDGNERMPSPDYLRTMKRSASGRDSHEKLIYTRYRDGLLNENKCSFETVESCFMCNNEREQQASTSRHTLIESRQKTGYKLDKEGQVPVYRTVFLCVYCMDEVKKKRLLDPSFSLKITSTALSYFSGLQ